MEKEATEVHESPLELLNSAESYHRGLRHVELQQMHGRSGYLPVAGCRWRLTTDNGEPARHDERPTTSAREIASTVYLAAREARRKPSGGDQRFRAQFFVAEDDGEVKPHSVKFEVVADTTAPNTGESVEAAQARTYIATMDILLGHVAALQASNEAMTRAVPDAIGTVLDKLLATLNHVIDVRLDAAEQLGQAVAVRQGGTTSTAFRDAARELVGIVRSPVGIAAAAKLMGMTPEQAAGLMAASSPPTGELQRRLSAFAASLTNEQKLALLGKLGEALKPLSAAEGAKDEATVREAATKFFAGLSDAHWSALGDILTEAQGQELGEVMKLTRTAEPA